MNWFHSQIIHAGIGKDTPKQLASRLKLTNWLAVFFAFCMGVPFVVYDVFFNPKLTFLPVTGILFCVGIILLNHVGAYFVSRIIASLVGFVLVAINHAYLAQIGEQSIPSVVALECSLLVAPFIVFQLKDWPYIVGAAAVMLILALSFDQTNALFEAEVDGEPYRTGFIGQFTHGLAIVQTVVSVFMLAYFQYASESKMEKALQESIIRNQDLQASEEKLKVYLQELEVKKIEDQRRAWASDGLAAFSSLLRDHATDQAELYDRFLAKLIKYIGANQGGLYLVDDDTEQHLIRMAACYAYDRKKYLNQTIEPGEGLLGQVYLEKESLYLLEVPQDYIKITSGLGDARPNNILIVPMRINDEVIGLVELASLGKFEAYMIEFVEKVAEMTAGMISNLKINEKTRRLLTESQQQTEQMQAQEEEMRQNMEELQATQEEMSRVQKELREREQQHAQKVVELTQIRKELEDQLRKQLQEIADQKAQADIFIQNSPNSIIYLDETGQIHFANNTVKKMFGYEPQELVGKSINTVLENAQLKGDYAANIQQLVMKGSDAQAKGKSKFYGASFPVNVIFSRGQAGGRALFTAMIQDNTKRVQLEVQMKKNLEAMQTAQKQAQERQKELSKLQSMIEEKDQLLSQKEQEILALQISQSKSN